MPRKNANPARKKLLERLREKSASAKVPRSIRPAAAMISARGIDDRAGMGGGVMMAVLAGAMMEDHITRILDEERQSNDDA